MSRNEGGLLSKLVERVRQSSLLFAGFAIFSRSLQQISTFVITVLAASFLLPAEYGVYSIAIIFIILIQTMTYTGFYNWIINDKSEDEDHLSVSFWMIVGLSLAGSLLMILFAIPLSRLFDSPEMVWVLILLALVQPLAGASAWYSALVLRRGRMGTHFGIMFAQNSLSLIFGVVFLILWKSLFALVAFRYARVLSGFFLYLYFSEDRPKWYFNKAVAWKASRFSKGLYASRFLNFLSRYSADLLLGIMFTTAEAGLFRFGNRVASGAIDIVSQPMSAFALSQFGAAGRKDEDLEKPLNRIVGALVMLTGGVAAVVIIFVRDIVVIFFEPAYLGALVVTFAMAVRSVAGVGRMVLEPALAAKGDTHTVMRFTLVWTVIGVISIFATAPFGLEILAWSQAVVMILCSAFALRVLHTKGGIKISGVLKTIAIAVALVILYGVLTAWSWPLIVDALGFSGKPALACGLAWALLLSLPTLLLGRVLNVFTLKVFSG